MFNLLMQICYNWHNVETKKIEQKNVEEKISWMTKNFAGISFCGWSKNLISRVFDFAEHP